MNEEMKEGEDISRLTAGQVARIGRQQSLQLKLSTNPVTVGLKMVLHLAPSHKIIFRIRQPKISRLEAGVAVRAVVKFRMPS